jgi:hypothetical protein
MECRHILAHFRMPTLKRSLHLRLGLRNAVFPDVSAPLSTCSTVKLHSQPISYSLVLQSQQLDQHNSVDRTTRLGVDNRGVWDPFPARPRDVAVPHHVQACSGAHPTLCPVGTRGCFSADKQQELWNYPLFSM